MTIEPRQLQLPIDPNQDPKHATWVRKGKVVTADEYARQAAEQPTDLPKTTTQ